MPTMIEIPQADDPVPAYLTLPPSGRGPGILFCHAWWGLTDTFKQTADRLAAAGFVVLAPDLYHGVTAATIAEAEAAGSAVEEHYQTLELEVLAALDYLARLPQVEGQRIGAIGYSFGAHYALHASQQRPEKVKAVVLYYGTGGWSFDASDAAYQGHFAALDEFENAADIEEVFAKRLDTAGRPFEYFIYPGTHHWFAEPNRPEYDPAAAALAEERAIAFFRQQLA